CSLVIASATSAYAPKNEEAREQSPGPLMLPTPLRSANPGARRVRSAARLVAPVRRRAREPRGSASDNNTTGRKRRRPASCCMYIRRPARLSTGAPSAADAGCDGEPRDGGRVGGRGRQEGRPNCRANLQSPRRFRSVTPLQHIGGVGGTGLAPRPQARLGQAARLTFSSPRVRPCPT